MSRSPIVAVLCAAPFVIFACGGAKAPPAGSASSASDAGAASLPSALPSVDPPATHPGGADTTSTMPAVVDAGPPAPPPDAHPFAKDAAAAESMIDDAIESRHSAVEKCAAEARTRAGDPHAKVSLLIGIDQEGNVIGIKTPKGEKKDEKLLVCVRAALKDAPFPKSHSGVITLKKTYEETLKGQL